MTPREPKQGNQRHKPVDDEAVELLRRLSHDLRTPMTNVLGSTELLLESQLDTSQRLARHEHFLIVGIRLGWCYGIPGSFPGEQVVRKNSVQNFAVPK